MKKLFLAAFAVFAFASVNAQDFGVFANFASNSFDGNDNASGFSFGVLADFEISESFSVQPEVAYTTSSVDDASYDLINVNAMARYHVSEEFSILAGPQIGFASGDIPDALDDAFGDDFSSMNLQLALGAAYNITENIFVQARYGFQLNEHVDGIGAVNTLNAGVGYRF
ncbi:porin family protein [Winogradskyella sp.]|uniref:porin family protein n=1 Tax=Winogradskyella sp. TaxID=1883156 RepID=UPI003F6BD175